MDNIEPILSLPFETLALLAAGYLSYRLAYTGKDETHKTSDVVFISLVFAFAAQLISSASAELAQLIAFKPGQKLVSIIGVLGALAVAAVWRKWFEGTIFLLLRKLKVSSSDRQLSAWQSLLARPPQIGPARLVVFCNDGVRLMCERLANFEGAPMGPCVFGQDGSVLMYVTHRKRDQNAAWEDDQTPEEVDPLWGYELTYVPSERVSEIRVGYDFCSRLVAFNQIGRESHYQLEAILQTAGDHR